VCAAEPARPVSAAEAQRLFHPLAQSSALVLAVSGGPDSTALLVLAARWHRTRKGKRKAPRLIAVTIDHGLRPQSAHEARSVRRLARRLGVPHRILRWRGKKPRTGLQQAARAARYRLLADVARSAKANHILTAHTLDDQAETVLMRMSRGSGITGLCAMREIAALPLSHSSRRPQSLLLVRPLIGIPKARLIATLRRAGIEYADDATNRDPRFARARVRDVMPALAREGLDAPRIALFARRLQRAESALESAVDAAAAHVSERTWGNAGPIVLDAEKFFLLPAEIALRLLGRAITHVGDEGSLRLGKLEALYEALVPQSRCAPSTHSLWGEGWDEGCPRLRRTLAGALVTLRGTQLAVERAPPRAHRRDT
jgi:tRNA(Ile)-lysidine synthase